MKKVSAQTAGFPAGASRVSPRRFLPLLSAATAVAALASSALAGSYTMTFNDLPYVEANGWYGQTVPAGYQPSELAGSGIVVGFGDGTANSAYPFYGASAPIGTNDATYARTGAGSGASMAGTTLTFNQPVYITRTALSSYMIQGGEAPADIAAGRLMTLSGYTNADDTTPAITVNAALSLHGEAWRSTMTWRDTIALQSTPITKLIWSAPGYGEVDDVTVSTTPGTNLAGDFNQNGVIDDGDYTIWADTYDHWTDPTMVGTPWDSAATWGVWAHGVDLRADANLNGFIDDGDYTTWADSYGQTAGALTAVPEPASLSLLVLGGSALLARRRK